MFGRSSGTFDRLLEKATSQLLLDPDWDSTLQICDAIRQGDVQAKYSVGAIKKKVQNDNPHVALYALQVLESIVKNCGNVVHEEIAIKEFMEFLKDQVKIRPDPVKGRILELVQVWSHAFRNEPGYKIVQDTFHLMKMEGYQFPTLKEADAMFMSEKAPEWRDGECCHRCRVQFGTFQRKHHCRACGQIFCNKCSLKNSIIPKFGIEREVRVCDSCFEQLNKGGPVKKDDDSLPEEYLSSPLSQQQQTQAAGSKKTPASKSEQEVQEEEELQLALALSKSEAEAKEKDHNRMRSTFTTDGASSTTSSAPIYSQPQKVAVSGVIDTSDMDPELARYLNRNYWEQKQDDPRPSTTQPSAPEATAEPKTTTATISNQPTRVEEKMQNGAEGGEQEEQQEFLHALQSSIEIFMNRMKSNSMRGRSIANDSSVQTLFMTISAMHPQLMKHLAEQEEKRTHYESLQDKLAQVKDAREALDALREEHRERRRREQEELERQRQIQMAHKLEILRQKKQEYLEYQRQMALQRMQEQEREMQMRFEQQKQMQQMRAMQYSYQPQQQQPQMYGQQQIFSPAGSTEGSPLHQPYPAGPGMAGAPGAPVGGAPNMPQGMGGPPGGQPIYGPMGYQMPPGGAAAGQPPPASFQGALPGGSNYHTDQNSFVPQTTQQQPQHGQGAPGHMPPVSMPPVSMPPQGQLPPGHMPPGQVPAGHAPPGQVMQGQVAPGQLPMTSAPQPSMDYQNFNMQNMAGALPTQPGGPVPTPQQQPPVSMQSAPGQPYMASPQQPQYPQQPMQQIQQQQQPPPHPHQQSEAQLICFD